MLKAVVRGKERRREVHRRAAALGGDFCEHAPRHASGMGCVAYLQTLRYGPDALEGVPKLQMAIAA